MSVQRQDFFHFWRTFCRFSQTLGNSSMKIAYLDTIAGISGDMTLGAFVSAGVSIESLSQELNKLNLDGVELAASHVVRSGIVAVKIDVIVSAKQEHQRHVKDIVGIVDGSSLPARVKEDA